MKKLLQNKFLTYSLLLAGGIILGWIFFHSSQSSAAKKDLSEKSEQNSVWTCSMHPQIRMHEPGKCPICGMDLIPLSQGSGSSVDPDEIHLSKDAAQLANIITSVAMKQKPEKEVRLYGKVQADERLLQSQVAHISGRIESLKINFTGESVSKGQVLAEIYSPELVNAQQELLEALRTRNEQPLVYKAAREKLSQWKLTDEQINDIEKSAQPQKTISVESNTNGIVTARRVNTGDYVSQGTPLFDIADLSKVWIMFDAYESDLQFLKKGEKISFTLKAFPGEKYSGNITFIEPVIDPVTRVARVRVESDNQAGKLKPEMFATGTAISNLSDYANHIVIPGSSVLWTGKRSLVYVKFKGSTEPVFKLREVELGPRLGDNYIITDGLAEGEEIVTSGTFSVDAAAQLEGKKSMMNTSLSNNENLSHSVFHVSGLCEMCKDRIEKAALSVSGVSRAEWDIVKKEVTIDFDSQKTDVRSVQKAIAFAGHDTEPFKADDKTYNALPECCLYRK
jgi:membrane fusion protein, copper/silver efflux system